MKKFSNIGLIVIAAVLVVTGILNMPSYATVPGANTGIDVNTSSLSPTGSVGIATQNLIQLDTSQDGRYVVFQSPAIDLVTPNTTGTLTQLFVRDRLSGTTDLISKSTAGVIANAGAYDPRISDDGRYVVFDSTSTNLVSSDTNGKSDVFIRDRTLNTITRVSVDSSGSEANSDSSKADVSADGRFVVWESFATNLVSSPVVSGGAISAIYIKNMLTGVVTLISQNTFATAANATSVDARISCEGRIITFNSRANNLTSGDTYNPSKTFYRTYVVDMLGTINPQYTKGNANASNSMASVSCNGNYLVYSSAASNLVAGDTNGKIDAFLYDRINGTTRLISVDSSGTQGNDNSTGTRPNANRFASASVSNDGKYVVFESSATNLVSGDTNALNDIFIRNTQANTTELISRDSTGALGNAASRSPEISSDGKYVNYYSDATNLVSGFTGKVYASKSGADFDY